MWTWLVRDLQCKMLLVLLPLLLVKGQEEYIRPSDPTESASFRMSGEINSHLCSEWEFEPCIFMNSLCGSGYRIGHRSGELCTVRTLHFYCWAPCEHMGAETIFIPTMLEGRDRDESVLQRSHVKVDGSEQLHGDLGLNFNEAQTVSCTTSGDTYILPDGCEYQAGEWSPCSKMELYWRRTDTFVSKGTSTASCHAEKSIVQECRVEQMDEPRPLCHAVQTIQATPVRPTKSPIVPDSLLVGPGQTKMAPVTLPPVATTTTRVPTEPTRVPTKPTRVPTEPTMGSVITSTAPPTTPPKCRYKYRPWSRCADDASGKMKVRSQTRVLVTEISDPSCPPKVTITRNCFRNSGKERCFFTPWSSYSECDKTGRMFKTRQVLFGGQKCKEIKKTIKTRVCKPTRG